jgi:penicillin amidase
VAADDGPVPGSGAEHDRRRSGGAHRHPFDRTVSDSSRRRAGDLLRDGSTSAADWLGDWPLAAYPAANDPKQGYLASANQQPIDPRISSRYLGSNWYAPWRALRINQLLRADSAATPEAMMRYQTDPGSPRADLFVPVFVAAGRSGGDPGSRKAAELLAGWDRRYTRENTRAVLFEVAMDELSRRTWDRR